MVVTLDLKTLGWARIIIGVLVLIVFCFMKNLIVTIKHTNKILEDSEKISSIAAQRTEQVNESVGEVAEALGQVAETVKGNQNVVAALTSVINALGSLKNLIVKMKDH